MCLPPAPSAGVSVAVFVCRNGNKIQGGSGGGLDREESNFSSFVKGRKD